jgi:hypothetical protein
LQANCNLLFSGQQQTFTACQDLSSVIGAPYEVLWSLRDEGNGSSVLTAAINVQSSGWAAFGFPVSPGSGMLGGSAMVVKANASAPSGGFPSVPSFPSSLFPLQSALLVAENLTYFYSLSP